MYKLTLLSDHHLASGRPRTALQTVPVFSHWRSEAGVFTVDGSEIWLAGGSPAGRAHGSVTDGSSSRKKGIQVDSAGWHQQEEGHADVL